MVTYEIYRLRAAAGSSHRAPTFAAHRQEGVGPADALRNYAARRPEHVADGERYFVVATAGCGATDHRPAWGWLELRAPEGFDVVEVAE